MQHYENEQKCIYIQCEAFILIHMHEVSIMTCSTTICPYIYIIVMGKADRSSMLNNGISSASSLLWL